MAGIQKVTENGIANIRSMMRWPTTVRSSNEPAMIAAPPLMAKLRDTPVITSMPAVAVLLPESNIRVAAKKMIATEADNATVIVSAIPP